MAHGPDDLEEEGFSVSLDYDPRPDPARGLSLSVHQKVGAQTTGAGFAVCFGAPGGA